MSVPAFTADDLDPAYGSHGTNPHGVHYLSSEKVERFAQFLTSIQAGKSIRRALRDCGVSWATIGRWLATSEEMSAQYERARSQSSDVWADRAIREAWKAEDKETAFAAKVRSDAAKWRASVQDPRRWSEKQTEINVGVQLTTNTLHIDLLRHRSVEPPAIEYDTNATVVSSNTGLRLPQGDTNTTPLATPG